MSTSPNFGRLNHRPMSVHRLTANQWHQAAMYCVGSTSWILWMLSVSPNRAENHLLLLRPVQTYEPDAASSQMDHHPEFPKAETNK